MSPPLAWPSVQHMTSLYRDCVDFNACFAIRPTVAYTGLPEFAVFATKPFAPNTRIRGLVGYMVPLVSLVDPASPRTLRSLITAQDTKRDCRLMGPISRVNHQCRNFTAKFVSRTKQLVELQTVRSVCVGEELTVNYSPNYFGQDNEDCLCTDCEDEQANGWSPSGEMAVDSALQRTRTRSAHQKKNLLELTRFSYISIDLPAGPRRAGDYVQALQAHPCRRCIAAHCQILFIAPGSDLLCYSCQERIQACKDLDDTVHRYYRDAITRSV
jgi:hypothetical protein